MRHLETHPSVAAKLATGEVNIHGWVYDIANGDVTCYDEGEKAFVQVQTWYDKAVRKSA